MYLGLKTVRLLAWSLDIALDEVKWDERSAEESLARNSESMKEI